MKRSHLVLRDDLSEAAAALVAGQSRVAWDIETTSLDWASGRIATVQLAAPDVVVIVQLSDLAAPKRLRNLLADPSTTKIFHHAPFDLRFMSWWWRVQPQRVACTKIASKILDPEIPAGEHSLRPVLARHLGVAIDKSQQTSDWARPTLSQKQVAYAANDVIHLLPLFDELVARVKIAGRLDLLQASFEYLPVRVQLDLLGPGDVYSY